MMAGPKDESGNRYGKLVVQNRAESAPSGQAQWSCKCDCGNVVVVRGGCLRSGHTKSCGCSKTDRALPNGVAALNKLWYVYRRNAKLRELKWELTKEQFRAITSEPCHYCGAIPAQIQESEGKTSGCYIYNGIDRLDSANGYVVGNIVACCGTCNRMKMDMPYKEFMMQIARIYARAEVRLTWPT
jgi:hypothetical protein